jgi:hypothetical protein
MEDDAQKSDRTEGSDPGSKGPAPVIDFGAARAKIRQRKERLEAPGIAAALRVREEMRRETAGSNRRYRFARVVQIAVLGFAVIYLLNTCGFLKF